MTEDAVMMPYLTLPEVVAGLLVKEQALELRIELRKSGLEEGNVYELESKLSAVQYMISRTNPEVKTAAKVLLATYD